MNRIFFAKHSTTGKFIAVTEGETGYNETTVETQEHADVLNERMGNTPAEVEAAVVCSMFDNWDSFEKIAARMANQ